MEPYGPSTYGDHIAEVYDAWHDVPADTDQAVAFLAGVAGEEPILELGIGTGRVALPLAAQDLTVHGIDASQAMINQLRDKPGGSVIPVTIGDFADLDTQSRYSVVFVVFNTFFALLTQDDQCRCFASVAEHLAPGGRFVIQAFVPDLSRFDRDQRVSTGPFALESIHLNLDRHHAVDQRVTSAHVVITRDGMAVFPVEIRYAYPPELDLMARLAGLTLEARYGGWQRELFDGDSPQHISVYRKQSLEPPPPQA